MKKILIALLAIVMITGCSTSKKTQTLFVEKNKKYALCDTEGDLKTKFKYTSYQDVQDEGYLVSIDKKTSYISKDGKDVIAYKKGVTLSALESMIIAKDEKGLYTLYNLSGKILYKENKKTKISLYGLPVIYKNKKYSVLDGNGDVLVTSKKKITYASVYNSSFILVGYEKKSVFYDTSSNSQIDENGLSTKLIGQYDIMNQDYKKGFLVYDQKQKMFGYVDLKGKLIFKKNIEVTSAKFSGSTIVVTNNDQIRLFSINGKEDAIATTYYKNINNYLVKNASYIYGPHKFVENGKTKDVTGIQLNPKVSYVNGKMFPVYVQNKGYQYYTFSGKKALKTIFKDAQDFDKNGLAVVSKDGEKYYLMNKDGKKVSKNYVSIQCLDKGYYAAYETNSKYEVIDKEGQVVINDYFMAEGQIFEFDGVVYGILNKSGTTYLYNMDDQESVFSLEGEYVLYQDMYLMKKNHKAYYDLEGNVIYKE